MSIFHKYIVMSNEINFHIRLNHDNFYTEWSSPTGSKHFDASIEGDSCETGKQLTIAINILKFFYLNVKF